MKKTAIIGLGWFSLIAMNVMFLLPTLDIDYYGDDFQFLPPIEGTPIQLFWSEHPGNGFYRPLQNIILVTVQQQLAPTHVLIPHVINLIAHIILVLSVAIFVSRFTKSHFAGCLAGLTITCLQTVAAPLGNIDMLSQTFGAVFGTLSVLMLLEAYYGSRKHLIPLLSLSYVMWLLALLSKETALGYAFPLLAATLYHVTDGEWQRSFRWQTISKLILWMIPYGLLTLAYIVLRSMAVSSSLTNNGSYSISLGLHIFKNIVLFGVALASPIGTPTLFDAIEHRNFVLLGVTGVLVLLPIGLILRYVVVEKTKRFTALLIMGCLVLSTFPAVLLQHVSELYVYNMLPFYGVLFGLGIWHAYRTGSRSVKGLIAIVLVIFLIVNIIGLRQKIADMNDNGEASAQVIDEIVATIDSSGQEGTICVVVPDPIMSDKTLYSVFVMNNENRLEFAEAYIAWLAAQRGIEIEPQLIFDADAENMLLDATCKNQ